LSRDDWSTVRWPRTNTASAQQPGCYHAHHTDHCMSCFSNLLSLLAPFSYVRLHKLRKSSQIISSELRLKWPCNITRYSGTSPLLRALRASFLMFQSPYMRKKGTCVVLRTLDTCWVAENLKTMPLHLCQGKPQTRPIRVTLGVKTLEIMVINTSISQTRRKT